QIAGSFSDGSHPLSSVLIDHAELDITLVDSVLRCPLGSVWLTLGVDAYSRMVVGHYLTFEAPSAFSAGRCIANGILHKQPLLERLGLGACVWPCYGVPSSIFMDNAKEFHGDTLRDAMDEYSIESNF